MPVNVILGLKKNAASDKLVDYFSSNIKKIGNQKVKVINVVYTKEEFEDAVKGKQYQYGAVLERLGTTSIGQGSMKQWKTINPDMSLVLLMDDSRRATAKANGLFEKNFYTGLFLKDMMNLFSLLENGRSDKDAYVYYGIEEFKRAEEEREKAAQIAQKTVEATSVESATPKNVPVEPLISKLVENVKPTQNNETDNVTDTPLDNSTKADNDTKVTEDIESEGTKEDTKEVLVEETLTEETAIEEVDMDETEELPETDANEKTEVADSEVVDIVETDRPAFEKHSPVFSSSEGKTQKSDRHRNTPIIRKEIKSKPDPEKVEIYTEKNALSYIQRKTKEATGEGKKADTPETEIDKYFISCYGYFTSTMESALNDTLIGGTSRDEFEILVYEYVEALSTSSKNKQAVYENFLSFVYGYDILESLIEMDDVTDIHVIAPDCIRIKQNGKRVMTNLKFHGTGRFERFVNNLVTRNRDILLDKDNIGTSYTDSQTSDDYLLQVTVKNSIISSKHYPELIIKKTLKDKLTVEELLDGGYISAPHAATLINASFHRKGILICGKRASGKTTLLNALLDYVNYNRSGVAIEYKEELISENHPEISIIKPYISSDVNISVYELASNALKNDNDYFILSDIQGKEAECFFEAMLSGCACWASLTANSCEDALNKLSSLISKEEEYVKKVISNNIDLIVYMDDWKISKLYSLNGYDDKTYDLKIIV